MNFETTVLEKVSKVLNEDHEARFVNGTLFVRAPESYARKVFSILFKDYNGKVEPSMVGYEYAYDFVA